MIDLTGPKTAAQKHPQLLPLLEDISGGRLPANKDKIDVYDCSGELPVRPIHKRVGACEVDKALLKCADRTGTFKPADMGIYYDVENQCKVATNRHVLVVIPASELLGGENRSVDSDGGNLGEGFPDYRAILPTEAGVAIKELDPKELLAKVRGAVRVNQFCKGREMMVVLEDAEGPIAFDPKIVELALHALISTGTSTVTLEMNEGLITLLRDSKEPNKFAIIMPMQPYAGGSSRRHEETELIYTYLTHRSFE